MIIKNFYLRILLIIVSIGVVGFFTIWYLFFRTTYDSNGIPSRPVSYEYVSSQPEARLFYPEAQIISPFGSAQKRNETGWDVAFTGAVMASEDSSAKIYSWYDNWLTSHGWQKDAKAILGLASTQVSLQSYTKDGKGLASRETFYVAMDDKKQLSWTLGKKILPNTTVFEFRYIIK